MSYNIKLITFTAHIDSFSKLAESENIKTRQRIENEIERARSLIGRKIIFVSQKRRAEAKIAAVDVEIYAIIKEDVAEPKRELCASWPVIKRELDERDDPL